MVKMFERPIVPTGSRRDVIRYLALNQPVNLLTPAERRAAAADPGLNWVPGMGYCIRDTDDAPHPGAASAGNGAPPPPTESLASLVSKTGVDQQRK